MKHRIVGILLSVLVCLMAFPLNMVIFAEDEYCPFSGGAGTESDPYQISSAYDLFLLAELVNDEDSAKEYYDKFYVQTTDINLNNKNFTPIGTRFGETGGTGFRGHYNGNYHNIINLNVERNYNYNGLFGWIYGGSVENLSVEGIINCKETSNCGGIVGEIGYSAFIKNCSFIGTVNGRYSVGGITGNSWIGGTIQNCYSNAVLTSSEGTAGGIIGTGRISRNETVGSFTMIHCYATGSIEAVNSGGIMGEIQFDNDSTTIDINDNYYLDTLATLGISGAYLQGCYSLDNDFMKQADELLGKPFVHNDAETLNNGYPVFEWQAIPYEFKGSGTADDPYQISSKEELEKMRDLVNSRFFTDDYSNKCYIQTADIDLKNEKWEPIGTRMIDSKDLTAPLFWGSYNGNYHSITNLFVNETSGNKYSGLFGSFRGNGVIENLIVYGEIHSNGGCVGGISGEVVNGGGTIRNCAFIGDVFGLYSVGGIAGVIYQNGTIDSCFHIGNVSASDINETREIGGIVGNLFAGDHVTGASTVKNCYNIGEVNGLQGSMGSIVGHMEVRDKVEGEIHVINCYSVKDESPTTANGTYNSYEVTPLSESMLKAKNAADKLGASFFKNPYTDINNGYPIFGWQSVQGDVNVDGTSSVLDIVMLQKWLLCAGNIDCWQNADLYEDGVIDVFDLCMMKRKLIES